MNKKLISLLLALMMLVAFVMSSCSILGGGAEEGTDTGEDGEEDLSNRTPVTLTLWMPTLGATDEARQAVEDELNSFFKTTYTTAVEFRLFPVDEYEKAVMEQVSKIEDKIRADEEESSRQREILQSLRKAGITTQAESTDAATATEVATMINDIGQKETRYPAVGEYQFDIFLITSFDMYMELYEHDALQNLDSNLNTTSKVLKSYIYPTFLQAMSSPYSAGGTYAIPNNHGMGEYKFLLTNKELADECYYNYNYEDMSEANGRPISYYEDFIRDVARYVDDDSVAPLLSWVDPAGMTYWSENGEWSVLASVLGNESDASVNMPLTNIFRSAEYKANFKLMKEFEEAGMIADDPDTCEKFAVGVVSGTSLEEVKAKYGDGYNYSIYEYPRATQEEVFAGAFAVSTASKNLARAMEVITTINTNPEIRNLLQYGIENVNYRLNDDGLVERINQDYMMNIVHTGNTYIAYTEEGMDPNQWQYDMARNLDSIVSPYLYVQGLRSTENAAYYKQLSDLSAEYYEKMMNISLDEVDEFFEQAATEITTNEAFASMGGGTWEFGPATLYNQFYSDNFATAEPGTEDSTDAEGGEDAPAAE